MATKKFGYKNSKSKNGELTITLTKENSEALKAYAKSVNRNCRSIVNGIVSDFIKDETRRFYEQLSKEDLINLLTGGNKNG